MLALKLLVRNWRSGELKLLGVSLILAVAVLSGISIFTDRLESTLLVQSNSILGADTVVSGSQPHKPVWAEKATAAGIKQAQATFFVTVVYAGDEMLLAAVKAISPGYPLRGEFEISDISYAIDPADISVAKGIPAQGEAWVDSRLSSLLKIKVGDKIAVGEYELTIAHILMREPDGVNPLSSFGARLVMNAADIPLTKIIQPGGKIDYQWLLASDNTQKLQEFVDDLKPQLSEHQKIENIDSSRASLSTTLKTAKNFLLLTAVIAVLLAGVAIAIAARQFSERHTNQVALMKSLGVSAWRIRSLYFGQLFLLGVLAAAIGLGIGVIIQQLVATSLQQLYHLVLVQSSSYPYVLSFFSGLICVTFFALPALWFLPSVPPLKILRRELEVNLPQIWLQAGLALLAVVLLVVLFSRDIKIALIISAAIIVMLILTFVVAWLLLRLSKKLALSLGGIWRLAFASMQRRKGQSMVQILVFSLAMMLLLTLTIVRTSLIADWKVQVPADAPNHFLGNISAADVSTVRTWIAQHEVKVAPIYPDVRGRLVKMNGVEPTEELRKLNNSLRRELNLTWSADLAEGNKLMEGKWWDSWQKNNANLVGVSVEEDTAKKLQLKIGDQLDFSIGGLALQAEVASFRSVDWKSMKQNFFFIFEPYSLDKFSPTYGTSIFVPKEHKIALNHFLRNHPTILMIDFGHIIGNIQKIINQVSDGIQLVLWLTLVGGCLVLLAAVMSSIDSRKQEAGLLRALGSPRKLILGSVLIEFAIFGFLSGLIAIMGAEFLVLSLQLFVFKNPIQPHYIYWLLSPLIGSVFVAGLGVISCRHVVTTPPAVVLREAA
ncbi:MAG: FtsX-like permease family protein [Pseudomonadota bacterium]